MASEVQGTPAKERAAPAAGFDRTVDILVAGSGSGALMAALVGAESGRDVLIVEKEALWGGTSATSGAGVWAVDTDEARAAGFHDNTDDAFRYCRALSLDNVPDANIRAYIDHSADMMRYLHDHTDVRYFAAAYPDYHAENPGGSPTGYRTHLPFSLSGRPLGDEIRTMRYASPAASLFGFLNWNFDETETLLFRKPGWWFIIVRNLARYYLDLPFRLTSGKDRRLTLGNALMGGLRIALGRRKVPLWLNSPMKSLVTENGRVTGAVVVHEGKELRIGARLGVILATGGFERNAAMREKYNTPEKDPGLSGGTSGNWGDGIEAGLGVGAQVMNMHSTWAAPVFKIPTEYRGRLSAMERALPGSIMVNQAGKRYLNEAASYHVVGQQMAAANVAAQEGKGAGTNPTWVIFDRRFRNRYPMGPLYPLVPAWLHPWTVRTTVRKARTIEALAAKIGVDPATLAETVARFSANARKGEDPDFHRGEAAYDRMYGDQAVKPNPNLAPIDKAPFYAFPIYPGDIGTNGGLVTDDRGRVLDKAGQVIAGLYATGNCTASAMGESYPGAGVTIGPALTFGYLAARDMVGANA